MRASPPADGFLIDGLPFPCHRELIHANGGEAAFEGLHLRGFARIARGIRVPTAA
jgi:hypothetical protein